MRPLEAASRPTGNMAVAQQNRVELSNHLYYSGSNGTPGKPQLHVPQLIECLTEHEGIPGFSPQYPISQKCWPMPVIPALRRGGRRIKSSKSFFWEVQCQPGLHETLPKKKI